MPSLRDFSSERSTSVSPTGSTMNTLRTLPIFFALVPLFGGCNQQQASSAEMRAKQKPIAAPTAIVAERELPSTLLLAGTLKANQESELAANASGRVLRTMVERGSYVRSGQALAQLDVRVATLSASEAESNFETARTQKSAAEQECARFRQLLDRGAITGQEFDRQTTTCKTATSSTAAAEQRAAL